MEKNRDWFSMPMKDKIFFIGLVLYVFLFFLPWTYEIKLLDISLLAWGAVMLFLLAPITGILVALLEKPNNSR